MRTVRFSKAEEQHWQLERSTCVTWELTTAIVYGLKSPHWMTTMIIGIGKWFQRRKMLTKENFEQDLIIKTYSFSNKKF